MGGRLLRSSITAGLLILILCSFLLPAISAETTDRERVGDEYVRLRAINAVLRARLSLSNESVPYLILDVPEREIRLELKGVALTKVPIRKIAINRLASEVSSDTTRIAFCEIPFVLERDRWYEAVPTLAMKDSSGVMSKPDTTGALAERIRTSHILAVLHFERNLAVSLDGIIPIESRTERWKAKVRAWWRSMKEGTPEREMRRLRDRSVLIEIDMEPAQVRSLAPTLTKGTKLVLRF
jgi:hypothetical protein